MWGQEHLFLRVVILVRIIPTRVGTRPKIIYIVEMNEDHPHACGDKLSAVIGLIDGAGSSPRVWGQGLYGLLIVFLVGIIPTRVGTSF